MANNYLTFKVHLPEGTDTADKLLELRQQFVRQVELAGGKVTVNEVLPAFEDLGIARWIVDDCETEAASGRELLMSLGNVAADADSIFGNMVFEDEHGALHRVITTWEIYELVDPEDRAELLAQFHAADVQATTGGSEWRCRRGPSAESRCSEKTEEQCK